MEIIWDLVMPITAGALWLFNVGLYLRTRVIRKRSIAIQKKCRKIVFEIRDEFKKRGI